MNCGGNARQVYDEGSSRHSVTSRELLGLLERNGNMAIYLTWLGHSTFKIETAEGKTFLIDPWITQNPLCPDSEKHQAQVDVLLCTHGHGRSEEHTSELQSPM